MKKDADRIKPIETIAVAFFGQISNYQNVHNLPLTWSYSFASGQYAKAAGNLLLARPRVLRNLYNDILEKKQPREYPVEFEGPTQDVDTFVIELPSGFEVDDLSAPTDVDYGFASYQSKTEADGNCAPLDKLDQLKTFYRAIGSDERGTAVLKAKAN